MTTPSYAQKKIWNWLGDWGVYFMNLDSKESTDGSLTSNYINNMLSPKIFDRLFYAPRAGQGGGILAYRLSRTAYRNGLWNVMERITPLSIMDNKMCGLCLVDVDFSAIDDDDEFDYAPEVWKEVTEQHFQQKYPNYEDWLIGTTVDRTEGGETQQ